MNKYIILIILLVVTTIVCYAQVYEQKDRHGHVIYSDMPLSHSAKEVDLPTLNQTSTTTPTASPTTTPSKANTATNVVENEASQAYQTFFIASPKNAETIQNRPLIPVDIQIEPQLREGDKIQILLDSSPFGEPMGTTHFELANIDRGTHQLSAVVIDKNQNILNQSNAVTIYVHHASIFSIQNTGGRAPTAAPGSP